MIGNVMMRISIAIVALVGLTSHTVAQEPGNPKKGAVLAQSVCAQCHGVKAGQLRSSDPMAPSFSSVAKAPGMTDTALRVWLQSSHPSMPNFVLTNKEINNIVAYILSLKSSSSAM